MFSWLVYIATSWHKIAAQVLSVQLNQGLYIGYAKARDVQTQLQAQPHEVLGCHSKERLFRLA